MSTSYTRALEDLQLQVLSNAPLVWVVSSEEREVIRHLHSQLVQAKDSEHRLYSWSSSQGLVEHLKKSLDTSKQNETKKLKQFFNHIEEIPREVGKQVYIMKDMHVMLTDSVVREIKDAYSRLAMTNKVLVILSSALGYGPDATHSGVPTALEKDISVINIPLPDREHVSAAVDGFLTKVCKEQDRPKTELYPKESRDEIVRACSGLAKCEIIRALSTSLAKHGEINTDSLIASKNNMIRKNDIIEIVETNKTMSDVGGLDNLKAFLHKYKGCFSAQAKAYGVEAPRGIILYGVPGSGKSESAKATANELTLPLWQLDMGRVMRGIVGSSEARIRSAIDHIEACAPLVLWIDELEKGFSGSGNSGRSDAGTFSRVFGTLLTAMQDRMEDVFIIATSNKVEELPPELIRRFHEIFFVDLPGKKERAEIFDIHLKRRSRDPEKVYGKQLDRIIQVSDGYTGAEIEKAIKESIANAFHEGKKDIDAKCLIDAVKEVRPIAKVMKPQIQAMRSWADGKARLASIPEENTKSINIDDIGSDL